MYNSNWKKENKERGREAKNKKIKEQKGSRKGSTQAIKRLPGFGEQHRVQERNETSSTVWGKAEKVWVDLGVSSF